MHHKQALVGGFAGNGWVVKVKVQRDENTHNSWSLSAHGMLYLLLQQRLLHLGKIANTGLI